MKEKKYATAAFQELLKTLCLTEFPCGVGSWRSGSDQFAEDHYSTTAKDYNVQHEKLEVLHEFLGSGTWDVDTSWSREAMSLRHIAVSEPEKINETFVWLHFKTLRLIDKEIEELDAGLKKLANLKELILSVNKLKKIPAELLPSKLVVLELCYNELDSISSLANHCPALMHLGLSYNHLASVHDYKYFTAEYWPALMSLDLGYNALVSLVELIEKLATLPKLQNLVLIGNPLSLIPGYRGHVVDAMKNLVILDGSHVTADEKHHFKGLGKKKELILDEAQLVIAVGELSGIPLNEDMKEDGDQAEFPLISVCYHVEYDMLPNEALSERYTSERHTSASWFSDIDIREDALSERKEGSEVMATYKTKNAEWNEEMINLEYRMVHVTDDLIALQQFLKCGIKFTIYEEKTCHWPMTPNEEDVMPASAPNARKAKTDTIGKNTPTKSGTAKAKGGKKSAKEKGKKSTLNFSSDMRSDPPIVTKIGSCDVSLASFLDSNSTYSNICHCGGGPAPAITVDGRHTTDQMKLESSQAKAGKSKGKEIATDETNAKAGKATSSKKGTRGAEKPSPFKSQSCDDEDEMQLPAPITLSVDIHLVRWKTAADSMLQP